MRIKFLNSQKGYSLPELLLAAGIVLMISSIVLAGVKAFSEQRKKINITMMALSLQSSIQSAIKDIENYPEAPINIQELLKTGADEYKELSFKSNWRLENNDEENADRSLFTVGKNIAFDSKKNVLEDFADPKAVLRLYSQILQIPASSKGSFPLYRIGYRIVFADPKIPHLGSPLAEDQELSEFANGDFTELIPHDLYMGKSRGTDLGNVTCDARYDIGIHGFQRDTGAPICIEKINGPALPKSFPRRLSFVEGYYGDFDLNRKPYVTMDYVQFRSYTPPPNYIFQRIDTRAFDPEGGSPSGITYVFIYKRTVNFYNGIPLTGINSVTAKCPTSYYRAQRTSGICTIAGTTKIMGSCPIEVPGATPDDPPTMTTGPCDPDCAPGTNIGYTSGGNSVTCTFNPPRCPNGGSHSANLQVNTSNDDCIITEPETKSGP